MMEVGRGAAMASFVLVALAFATLINAYVTSDFSVLNVVENSHTDKPLLYKITGVWGNHEGSMMLWIFILTLFGAAVAWFGDNLPPELRARVLAVQGMIATGFMLFILFTSNPFLRQIPAPANGQGLNPVLQDPGLAFHPPFLYLGYVGFSVAFSFAVAALIEGRVDAAWARWVRPWTLAAWCALTIGIAMGSWWAYYTLGWGGWWFWDPVENASLMPWLAGTALVHSAIVVEKRDTLKSWTVLLAIITFSLSLVGTFLVRSGVLTSVHAFAVDPRRGTFILMLLLVAVGGSLGLYAVRAPALRGGGLFAPISREGALVLNNLLLVLRRGDGVSRHALSAVSRRGGRAQGLGRISVLRPHFRAADGAAAHCRRRGAAAWRGSAATFSARCSGCGSPSRRCWWWSSAGFMPCMAGRCWRCWDSRWRRGSRWAHWWNGASGCGFSARGRLKAGAARAISRAPPMA